MSTHAAHLTSHLSDELLSAYLDGELKETKAERVEQHLEACSGCRARVDGLRRVVRSLARLERAAPPPVLARRVERRIALEGRPSSMLERLENRLRVLPLDSPLVATFAVVLALGVIIYAFSHHVSHHRGDVSLQMAAPEAVEGLMEEIEAVEIDGRAMERRGDVWVEEGLGAEAATEVIPFDSPRGAALRAEHPWVEELLTLTGAAAVEFRGNAGAVRLERGAVGGEAGDVAEAPPAEETAAEDGPEPESV